MSRRGVVTAVTALGTALLGASLRAPQGSARFYGLTAATAATWVAGGVAAGPVPRGRRGVVGPVALGAVAFGGFYASALVARRIPPLRRALGSVLGYASGSGPLVLLSTLGSGAAEEVFFRGALYERLQARPVAGSTAVYVVVTAATGNPALVAAAAAMGTLWGLQRRRSGGIQAPLLTHVTWSALMLRFLPPLFEQQD